MSKRKLKARAEPPPGNADDGLVAVRFVAPHEHAGVPYMPGDVARLAPAAAARIVAVGSAVAGD